MTREGAGSRLRELPAVARLAAVRAAWEAVHGGGRRGAAVIRRIRARGLDRQARPAPATVALDGAAIPVEGAQVAILREGRVLLQLRAWPPGWELPGGHCEPGEDPAACAAREAEEETGVEVRVRGLVGVYRWDGLRSGGDAVYWADPAGGRERPSLEALRLRWCRPEALPRMVFPWIGTRVDDAVAVAAGAEPALRAQRVTTRQVLFFGSSWLALAADAARRAARRRRAARDRGR